MHNGQLVFVAIISLSILTLGCLGLLAWQYVARGTADAALLGIALLAVRELAGVVRWYEHVHGAATEDAPGVKPPVAHTDA